MPETVKNIAELILKYLRKELNEEEQNLLIDWVNQSEDNRSTFERLTNPDSLDAAVRELSDAREKVWQQFNTLAPEFANLPPPAGMHMISRKRLIVAVAALILLLAAVYFIIQQKDRATGQPAPNKNTKNLQDAP